MTADIPFGFSSYNFHSELSTGGMTLPQVIDWIAASEGEHLELAVLGDDADSPIPNIASDPAYVEQIRAHAEAAGVPLTNLAIGADFFTDDAEQLAAQVARVKQYVDLAERYGHGAAARACQDRFLAGDRDGAAAALTGVLLDLVALTATPAGLEKRLAAYRDAGVDTLVVCPFGDRPALLDLLARTR